MCRSVPSLCTQLQAEFLPPFSLRVPPNPIISVYHLSSLSFPFSPSFSSFLIPVYRSHLSSSSSCFLHKLSPSLSLFIALFSPLPLTCTLNALLLFLLPNDNNFLVLMQRARRIDAEPFRRKSPPLGNNSDKGEVQRNKCLAKLGAVCVIREVIIIFFLSFSSASLGLR